MTKHSKHYYDFTRNLSQDEIKQFHCGKPNCDAEGCYCMKMAFEDFDEWTSNLEDSDQPVCNVDDFEDCENCGS